jgi:hypothetical protein
MAKTRVELVYQTLRNLGALPMGQDPSDEDYNLVNDLIEPVQAMLRERDVYFLTDADVIPDEAYISLAHVMAAYSASSFGQQADNRIMALGDIGERHLQTMQSEQPHYTTLQIQAY